MKTKFFPNNLFLKRSIYCLLVLLLFLISGCLELEGKLTLNQDGSGTWQVKNILSEELTADLEQGRTSANAAALKGVLPVSEEELKEHFQHFQGKGVEIESSWFRKQDKRFHISYTIVFDNIREFMETKAVKQAKVIFYRDVNKNLAFQLETDAFREGVDPQTISEELKVKFALVLPNEAIESNADERGDVLGGRGERRLRPGRSRDPHPDRAGHDPHALSHLAGHQGGPVVLLERRKLGRGQGAHRDLLPLQPALQRHPQPRIHHPGLALRQGFRRQALQGRQLRLRHGLHGRHPGFPPGHPRWNQGCARGLDHAPGRGHRQLRGPR